MAHGLSPCTTKAAVGEYRQTSITGAVNQRLPASSRFTGRGASLRAARTVTSESFAADVKSETMAITDPGNPGNIGKNRNLPMTQSIQPGRFGHSGKPDDAWLAKQQKEPILEPELPIIDTHHHPLGPGSSTPI